MKLVLVTGANGQLGKSIRDVTKNQKQKQFRYVFLNSKELDITNTTEVQRYFTKYDVDYCINCAAYTAVDKAEAEQEMAFNINAEGVRFLAEACKMNQTTLIQVSTDFVFDGSDEIPYSESDKTNPINVYGASKLKGEEYVLSILDSYFIVRTSWVYSEYGHNFVKSMQKLGNQRNSMDVVQDQKGTPTYAKDLANFIVYLISNNIEDYGVYHFSNSGATNWYEFAKAIFEIEGNNIKVNPIFAKDYKTLAIRPKYSVLDKSLVRSKFNIDIPLWRESLKICLTNK